MFFVSSKLQNVHKWTGTLNMYKKSSNDLVLLPTHCTQHHSSPEPAKSSELEVNIILCPAFVITYYLNQISFSVIMKFQILFLNKNSYKSVFKDFKS